MFQGTIPVQARSIVHESVGMWDPNIKIQVLCSGNLTIERTLAKTGHELFGNDVTLYSCVLGAAAARIPFRCRVADAYQEEWGWLDEYLPLNDPVSTAATVVLASNFADAIDKPDHPYYQRLAAGATAQWETLHAKTVAKYKKGLPPVTEFKIKGALEVLRELPKSYGVLSFPPFWGGGYETMWKYIHKLFDWDVPEYVELNDDTREEMLERVVGQDEWLLGIPIRHEALEPYLIGCTKTSNRGMPINFYAKTGAHRVTMPKQKLDTLGISRLGRYDDVEGKLDVIPLSIPQFAMLRSQYMNRSIAPATPSGAYAVTVGGKLIGALAVSQPGGASAKTYSALRSKVGSFVYMLSDFAVAPSKYKRLSKLVLMAFLSLEMHVTLESSMKRRIKVAMTTAFMNNPTSMKYRGIFKVMSKTVNDKAEGSKDFKYTVNYVAPMGEWTLAEGLEIWKKKHGDKLREE